MKKINFNQLKFKLPAIMFFPLLFLGYMVVDCLGRIKGEYEDYIDLSYILENLYMDPQEYLAGVKGVRIKNA